MDTRSIPSFESFEGNNRQFSYSDVLKMTNNFERVLGKGGFGTVYHGYIDNDIQVAVKMLSPSSVQGYKQFQAEVCITNFNIKVIKQDMKFSLMTRNFS